MPEVLDALDRGRGALQAGRWQEAFDALSDLDASSSLDAVDLESLGEAAWWLRRLDECVAARERAFAAHKEAGHRQEAAFVALQLFHNLDVVGEVAIAAGWLGRAKRLLQDEPEGAVHAHLFLAQARNARAEGNVDRELERARRAGELGRRLADPDVVALAQYVEGRLLVKQGKVSDGMALLDEAMLAAAQGELRPFTTGQIYCNVIAACQELGDLRRAGEWTQALKRWCETHPTSVFPGLCRVHRAEVMHLKGEWTEAEDEARQACDELLEMMPAFAAEAFYEIGEVRRRVGDLAGAEEAFRMASQLGREPQPGLALVRLAQGNADVAAAAVNRALAEQSNRLARSKLLPVQVEIEIAAGDLAAADQAADELDQIAGEFGGPALEAAAASARGLLELARDDATAALRTLRRAWQLWQALDCPFEAASARRLLGLACRDAGDEEGAELAIGAAQAEFERLGAGLEAARTIELLGDGTGLPAGLTEREAQVLRLVAAGKSNREIADELYLSVKTVARHLSNIFCKLGVSSRTAATAFAYERGIVKQR